jgi:hypothetical protein
MREIVYAGGSFVTADDIAEALLEYAAELANAERAATVHVPAVGTLGESVEVAIVVGPASQLLSTPTANPGEPPEGAFFVQDVRTRISDLSRIANSMDIPSSVPWDV